MSSLINNIKRLKGPIAVLGASGFIGANLFNLLSKHRSDVFAIIKNQKGWRLKNVDDNKIISLNLNNSSEVRNFVTKINPKTIFDLISYGSYSFENNSDLIYQTNFLSLSNLLNELLKQDISAYIHAGSSSEYGLNSSAPNEEDLFIPNSHYSVSKIAASNLINYLGKCKLFPIVNLRLYSVYGPLEDTSRLIPNIVQHALQKKLPPLVSSKVSRDFIHIDDVCSAFIISAVKINPDIYGESFNIGTGTKTSISSLVKIVKSTFKINAKPNFGNMNNRTWDLENWYSDPSKAKKILGWKAEINLKTGLLKTAKWIKSINATKFNELSKINQIDKKSLTAIIACFKDEEAIPIMYDRLSKTFKKIGIDYEIIFVNDCSPDKTEEVITNISNKDSRVIGISHSRNFGSQMAFRSGLEFSSKDGVVLLDGDLQDPPELISEFFKKWMDGYDIVYGRRVKRDMPFYQEFFYKLFYRIFSAFSYVKIPLDAGDFSLIDKKAVNWILKCNEKDLFMRGIRAYIGFKQIGIDYVRPERLFGKSTNNFLKNIEWAKKGFFSFSNTPLTILNFSGVILFLTSFLLSLIVILMKIISPEIAPKGVTTLLLSILFFGSLNLLAIGIVGEYIAKIMAEVKNRPGHIKSKLIRHGIINELLPDEKNLNNY